MVELRRTAREPSMLRLDGATPGEYVERFAEFTKGKDSDRVAVMVWAALEYARLDAEFVRIEAARLVHDHANRLGLDLFASQALVRAIKAIEIES
jgi:hypothetical protein